jgi:hypothetical protein
MRHSSWTLFLVPLALPLVFLCMPGAMKSTGQTNPTAGDTHGSTQQESPAGPEIPGLSMGSGEHASGEISEALFKD